MPERAFDRVKDQMGYCGLWCGSCIVGNGALVELTKRYRGLLVGYGVDEWGSGGFDRDEFLKGLTSIEALPVCNGCRQGGGNEACRIRPCAQARGVSSCNDCSEFARCPHMEAMRAVRAGALRVGMIVETQGPRDPDSFRRWTNAIKDRFPCCVLDL